MEWNQYLLITKYPITKFIKEYGYKIGEFKTLNTKGIYMILINSNRDDLNLQIFNYISNFKVLDIVSPSIDEILDKINETKIIDFKDIVLLNSKCQ